jgi:pimeloyl-ACP methyl ester carboxylesterase
MDLPNVKYVRTGTLEIAYEDSGPVDGPPIFLLHGFPYDPRAYDGIVPPLVDAGYRTLVPYLRGYGPSRFLDAAIPRSGQQAALAHDLVELMDALEIERAAHVGYDWGGRAACIRAALWPQRVRCLISQGGYNIQDIPGSVCRRRPSRSIGSGINTIFTRSAAAPGSHQIGATSADCCGGCGRRIGSSMLKRSNGLPRHSITPISSMS